MFPRDWRLEFKSPILFIMSGPPPPAPAAPAPVATSAAAASPAPDAKDGKAVSTSSSSSTALAAPNFAALLKALRVEEAKSLVDRVWNCTLHEDLLKLANNQCKYSTRKERTHGLDSDEVVVLRQL